MDLCQVACFPGAHRYYFIQARTTVFRVKDAFHVVCLIADSLENLDHIAKKVSFDLVLPLEEHATYVDSVVPGGDVWRYSGPDKKLSLNMLKISIFHQKDIPLESIDKVAHNISINLFKNIYAVTILHENFSVA